MFKQRDFNSSDREYHQNISSFPSGEPAKIATNTIEGNLRIEIVVGVDEEELSDPTCFYALFDDNCDELLESYCIYWDKDKDENEIIDYFNNLIEGFPKDNIDYMEYENRVHKYLREQGMQQDYDCDERNERI